MLIFYWVAFGLMLVAAIYCYKTGRSLFALNGIILISFISFFVLWYSGYNSEGYTALDSVRVVLITILTLHCGMLSKSTKLYLIYALALFAHLLTNGARIIFLDIEPLADNIYLAVSIIEMILFVVGMIKTIKTNRIYEADYGRNTDDHYINFNSEYFSWSGRSAEAIQKGETR